jgi:hypothetical protein
MLWLKLHKQISPSITMFPRGLFTSTNITTQLFRTFFFCFIRFFVIPPSRMFVECLHPFLCDTIYLKQWKIIHFSIIFRENCVDYIRYSNILIEEYGTYTIYYNFSQSLRSCTLKRREIVVSILDGDVFIILLVAAVITLLLLLNLEKGKAETLCFRSK